MITYNLKYKLYELVNLALLEDETEETYNEYYSILKNKYSFTPHIIKVDYALSNINSIKKVFDSKNSLILTCNFHFVQAIWRNCNKIGSRKKRYCRLTKLMVFHLQLLQFMDYNTGVKFYKKLKEYIQKDQVEENDDFNLYESFFAYIEKTLLNLSEKNNSFFEFDFGHIIKNLILIVQEIN